MLLHEDLDNLVRSAFPEQVSRTLARRLGTEVAALRDARGLLGDTSGAIDVEQAPSAPPRDDPQSAAVPPPPAVPGCCICLSRGAEYACLPCGHRVACSMCAEQLLSLEPRA